MRETGDRCSRMHNKKNRYIFYLSEKMEKISLLFVIHKSFSLQQLLHLWQACSIPVPRPISKNSSTYYSFLYFLFLSLTSDISTVLANISCRARTDRDCSRMKLHMARSGGIFCEYINNTQVKHSWLKQGSVHAAQVKKREELIGSLPEHWMWFPGSRDGSQTPRRTDIA